MRTFAYISLVFAPIIAVGIYWYFRRKCDPSFRNLLIKSYIGGAIMVILLIGVQLLSNMLGLTELRSLKRTLFYSFVITGFTSEFSKFLVLRYMILPKKAITRPIHVITFSIMVALGFVTVRLICFFIDPFFTQKLYPFTLYALIAVPASIMFAVILGFFIGMSKFTKTRVIYSLTGLLVASFFHGLYNFCLFTNDFKLLSLFAFGATVIVFILGLRAAYADPESLQ